MEKWIGLIRTIPQYAVSVPYRTICNVLLTHKTYSNTKFALNKKPQCNNVIMRDSESRNADVEVWRAECLATAWNQLQQQDEGYP